MSRVLVVEPRKILQLATTIALFPDHEARVVESVPGADELQNFDAVIVDAVALREANALPAQTLRAMAGWSLPMVWVDGVVPQAPRRDRLIVVKRPVSREAMREAVAESLGRDPQSRSDAAVKARMENTMTAMVKRRRIVDLVDVVAAGPAGKPSPRVKPKK